MLLSGCGASPTGDHAVQWWKGNLHTHSLWSDGDDFPEVIIDWYRQHNYDFVAMTDHNVRPDERWIDIENTVGGWDGFERYVERFGAEWVEQREVDDTLRVRLRPHAEYASLFNETGQFLVIKGEEITEYIDGKAVHLNATNLARLIEPRGGESVQEIMNNNTLAVREQEEETGQPILLHVNHPNFVYSLTPGDLIEEGGRFFEVYNGHPLVNNSGSDLFPSTERLWDVTLAFRISRGAEPIYGLATDDAHDYHEFDTPRRNPGRGWVRVRAPELTPDALISAMREGDFYASSGVRLSDVRYGEGRLAVEIEPEEGVRYTTRFIGTRRGFSTDREPVHDEEGNQVSWRYSSDIGEVLAEVDGANPSYELAGDELYVRAIVISSKPKDNPPVEGEVEKAWVQPLVTGTE